MKYKGFADFWRHWESIRTFLVGPKIPNPRAPRIWWETISISIKKEKRKTFPKKMCLCPIGNIFLLVKLF